MHTNPSTAAAAAAVAAVVKEHLRNAGLSESEASRQTGIPVSTLNRRVSGALPGFNMMEIFPLASLLGADASDLLRQAEARLSGLDAA